jgi:hypothetical protein
MKSKTVLTMSALLVFGSAAFGADDPATAPALYDKGSYEGTPWVSGGVGLEERNYMLENLADDYNLKLEIAVADGSYLADAEVMIAKPDGAVVMKQVSSGPWFMTRLPAGSYRVQVSGFGQTFEQTVEVPATGLKTVVFNQWTKKEVAKETPGPTY